MDIRFARILAERGSYKSEAKELRPLLALLQQIRAGKLRGRYRRPQDLAKLPRNPAEAVAREDLLAVSDQGLRMVKRVTRLVMPPREERLREQIKRIKELTGW